MEKIKPPRYNHDNTGCTYLGRFKQYDLYYSNEPTVIARYSERPSDYKSGLCFATPTGILPLYEAKLRYKKLQQKC